jgi:lipopolysaccharide export system protein LptC
MLLVLPQHKCPEEHRRKLSKYQQEGTPSYLSTSKLFNHYNKKKSTLSILPVLPLFAGLCREKCRMMHKYTILFYFSVNA